MRNFQQSIHREVIRTGIFRAGEVLSFAVETKQVWLELCAQAAISEDLSRLRQLETQIVEVLRREQHRLEAAETFHRPKTIQDDKREQGAAQFDLVILGHSIPTKDKERIIGHLREHCDAPILALLRPHEGPVRSSDRSADADAEKFVPLCEKC